MVCEAATANSTRARVTSIRADLNGGLKSALGQFAVDCGRYPTTLEGLSALINCPTNISQRRWRGPYLDPAEIPQDPWGNVYVYRCPGIHNTNSYDLYSCGYDGISKSGGDDLDDINNWDSGSPHGGNDFALNSGQLFFLKFRASIAFPVFLLILVLVPLLGAARLIASVFSQRVRDSIARHPTAHFIWFVVSLGAIFIFLSCMNHPSVR